MSILDEIKAIYAKRGAPLPKSWRAKIEKEGKSSRVAAVPDFERYVNGSAEADEQAEMESSNPRLAGFGIYSGAPAAHPTSQSTRNVSVATTRERLRTTGAAPRDPTIFAGLGEFLHAVRFNPDDKRLASLFHERSGEPQGSQRMDDGASGGFAVPTQFRSELLRVKPTAAIMRPRAMVLPAGTPPDAALVVPALDQSAATNMYGGVSFSWLGEGGLKPETGAKIREVKLEPHEIAGVIKVTDKLLRNWQAAGPFLSDQLRAAIIAAEDQAFLTGNGIAKPLGALYAPCAIDVNRATPNQIAYADVLAMEEALFGLGEAAFWTCTKRARTWLRQLKNPAGFYIWQEDAQQKGPPKLLGYPVVIGDRLPTLGTRGDLMLIDGSSYLIKDGSGPFVAMSEHAHFTTNETLIKIFWNVDGQSWVKDPIKTENGELQTPFVILN